MAFFVPFFLEFSFTLNFYIVDIALFCILAFFIFIVRDAIFIIRTLFILFVWVQKCTSYLKASLTLPISDESRSIFYCISLLTLAFLIDILWQHLSEHYDIKAMLCTIEFLSFYSLYLFLSFHLLSFYWRK